jgi:hypothetical protein
VRRGRKDRHSPSRRRRAQPQRRAWTRPSRPSRSASASGRSARRCRLSGPPPQVPGSCCGLRSSAWTRSSSVSRRGVRFPSRSRSLTARALMPARSAKPFCVSPAASR